MPTEMGGVPDDAAIQPDRRQSNPPGGGALERQTMPEGAVKGIDSINTTPPGITIDPGEYKVIVGNDGRITWTPEAKVTEVSEVLGSSKQTNEADPLPVEGSISVVDVERGLFEITDVNGNRKTYNADGHPKTSILAEVLQNPNKLVPKSDIDGIRGDYSHLYPMTLAKQVNGISGQETITDVREGNSHGRFMGLRYNVPDLEGVGVKTEQGKIDVGSKGGGVDFSASIAKGGGNPSTQGLIERLGERGLGAYVLNSPDGRMPIVVPKQQGAVLDMLLDRAGEVVPAEEIVSPGRETINLGNTKRLQAYINPTDGDPIIERVYDDDGDTVGFRYNPGEHGIPETTPQPEKNIDSLRDNLKNLCPSAESPLSTQIAWTAAMAGIDRMENAEKRLPLGDGSPPTKVNDIIERIYLGVQNGDIKNGEKFGPGLLKQLGIVVTQQTLAVAAKQLHDYGMVQDPHSGRSAWVDTHNIVPKDSKE